MRKKFAMRLRRKLMRRGVKINSEGLVFSKKELRKDNLSGHDNAYQISVSYKRHHISIADDDILKAYKLLEWCLDVIDEDEVSEGEVLCGACRCDTGNCMWSKDARSEE